MTMIGKTLSKLQKKRDVKEKKETDLMKKKKGDNF